MARNTRAVKSEEERVFRRKITHRKTHLKRAYGITIEQYNEMLIAQDGRCAICKTTEPGGRHGNGTFMVDHCHVTGKIRKLLCNRCNMVLGYVKDSASLLQDMKDYLCHTTSAP